MGSARIHDVRARVIASCLNSTDSRSGQLSPSVAETASQPMNATSGVMLRRFDDAHGPRRLPLCCLNAPPSTMTLAVPSATAWSTDRPPTRMVMSLRVDRRRPSAAVDVPESSRTRSLSFTRCLAAYVAIAALETCSHCSFSCQVGSCRRIMTSPPEIFQILDSSERASTSRRIVDVETPNSWERSPMDSECPKERRWSTMCRRRAAVAVRGCLGVVLMVS